jgi:hypothetical protein
MRMILILWIQQISLIQTAMVLTMALILMMTTTALLIFKKRLQVLIHWIQIVSQEIGTMMDLVMLKKLN